MLASDTEGAALIAIHSDVILPTDEHTDNTSRTTPVTVQRSYLLDNTICRIGRNQMLCQVTVRPERVDISREHAAVTQVGPRYVLEDRNSTHGTYVNGERIVSPWTLHSGDVIGLAGPQAMLRFDDPSEDETPPPEPLTERETEVLRLVALGLKNNEIAEQLQIAVDTVKTRLKHIFQKLHVDTRTEAVDEGRRWRMI